MLVTMWKRWVLVCCEISKPKLCSEVNRISFLPQNHEHLGTCFVRITVLKVVLFYKTTSLCFHFDMICRGKVIMVSLLYDLPLGSKNVCVAV